MDGEAGVQSKRYLRDMFAPFGTSSGSTDEGSINEGFWSGCVVKGEPDIPKWNGGAVAPEPFVNLLAAARTKNGAFVAKVTNSDRLEMAIDQVAAAMGVIETGNKRVAAIAEAAGALLTSACRHGAGVRATSIDDLGKRLFPGGDQVADAVRGLMLARALPESPPFKARVAQGTPSFRVHAFVRNVEGLFGAPVLQDGRLDYQDLSVERGLSHGQPAPGEVRGRRLFEMLYCEACGDLLLGGQRGRQLGTGSSTELLPSTADLGESAGTCRG